MCYTAELIMRIAYNRMYGWDALMKAMTAVLRGCLRRVDVGDQELYGGPKTAK
jgi:hypothetical protein